jgi:hypothetical protein
VFKATTINELILGEDIVKEEMRALDSVLENCSNFKGLCCTEARKEP